MSKNIIDTNLLIRFFVDDDHLKASRVAILLKGNDVYIFLEVVFAEIVWVLSSYYSLPKEEIVEKLKAVIHSKSISCDKKLYDKTLAIWAASNISFIDAYIAAKAEINNLVIYSYDRDFDKVVGVVRKEP